MKRAYCAALIVTVSLFTQAQSEPPKQTARQALLEMFFGKSPQALQKHLSSTVLKELKKADADSSAEILRVMSSFVNERLASGEKVQTFDVGPVIVLSERPESFERTEVTVERDDLSGDEDEIEVSVSAYKNGQPVRLPVLIRLTFVMKEEEAIWRLNRLVAAAHVPLGDEDYVKGIMKDMQDSMNQSHQAAAMYAMRTLLSAEMSYQTNSSHGFACTLAELGASSSGQGKERLIGPELASGKSYGYQFTISECSANSFHLTATPVNADSGMRAYCVDESSKMKFSKDGKASTCWSTGTPINEE